MILKTAADDEACDHTGPALAGVIGEEVTSRSLRSAHHPQSS